MAVTSTLKPLPLKSVKLLPGTPFARAEKTNLEYLNMCARMRTQADSGQLTI